jgi:PAS domain S-box-containing protein
MKLQHNLIIRDKIFAAQKLQAMVLSQIHDRILITDLEGHVIYVNQAVMEATGFSQQELLEMNIRDLSKHPLSDSAHEELLQDTLRCGSSRMELQNSAKDGGELYVDIRTIRVDDDEGKPVALCAVGTEITERVIYLNLLRRQNAVNLKLTELSRLLLSARSDNFELMIDDFLQAVARLLNLDRSHIFLMDGLLPCIRKYYEWCQEGIESQLDKMRDIDAHTAPKMICELVAQRLVFIDDTQDLDKDWQAERKFLKKRGVRALFAAPLVNEATILGFLGFDMVQEPRSWDEIDSMVIQITADLLAATIQRLRSESGTA